MKLLLRYYSVHHLLTIDKIIRRWCGDQGVVGKDYVDFVSKFTGISPNQPLYYYHSLIMIGKAIADFEAGEPYIHPINLYAGFLAAMLGATEEDHLPLDSEQFKKE